jgi:hypothetical protein
MIEADRLLPAARRPTGGISRETRVQTRNVIRLPALDVAAARREVDDRVFGCDRLREATMRLGTRQAEVKKAELL